MPRLLGICGSLRAGSFNRMLLREAARVFAPDTFEEADIRLPLYDGDLEDAHGIPAAVQALADQIARADAVIIATPEYNKSIPGGLKNALDWVSRTKGAPWMDKPVSILSAAAGMGGGDRAQYALRLALAPFGPRVLNGREVLIGGAHDAFDAGGQLKNPKSLEFLGVHVQALKALIAMP